MEILMVTIGALSKISSISNVNDLMEVLSHSMGWLGRALYVA